MPRYRCTACGNLTRFDVVTSRRTRAFHHYTIGGDLEIEDEETLAESVESVGCRWCGPAGTVERVDGGAGDGRDGGAAEGGAG
ncbi:MAG: hypothetical protein H0W25_03645 [Acidimicrobiia bacterium]|nr:hypothetical protein [Acidimicrobiia bacterium]